MATVTCEAREGEGERDRIATCLKARQRNHSTTRGRKVACDGNGDGDGSEGKAASIITLNAAEENLTKATVWHTKCGSGRSRWKC